MIKKNQSVLMCISLDWKKENKKIRDILFRKNNQNKNNKIPISKENSIADFPDQMSKLNAQAYKILIC